MPQQPTLSIIARTKIADAVYQITRVFVFEADPETGAEGYVVVYIAQEGKAIPILIGKLISFTRSQYQRREPHLIDVGVAGETVMVESTLAGCGCGDPVKGVNWTTALKDYEASLVPAPE